MAQATRIALFLFSVVCLASFLQGDGDVQPDQCPVVQATTHHCLTTEDIKSSINQFTVRMYQEVASLNTTTLRENIIILPVHAANALLISCHATGGDTKQEIISGLKLGTGLECLDAFAVIQDMYRTTPHRSDPPDPRVDDFTFAINRQYVDKTVNLKEEYVAALAKRSNHTPGIVDFKNNPEPARKGINVWVALETRGNIRDILPPGSVRPGTMLTMTNAHFLQINWAFPFDPKLTGKGNFTSADGAVGQVDMMRLITTSLFYFNNLDQKVMPNVPAFHMVRLPHKWGNGVTSVFVPKEAKDFPALEKALTVDMVFEAMDKAQRRSVNVTIPKFAFENNRNLADVMKRIGITKLFGAAADWAPMTNTTNVQMDGIAQKAMIDFNERGLKAAAATVLPFPKVAGVTTMDFRVDRPFFFTIRLDMPKILTYIGRVTELPSQNA